MKLKKYCLNGDIINKAIRNDSETSLYSESSKGTEDNPYTIMEYAVLVQEGQWKGGYVQYLGYIREHDFVLASDSTSGSIDLVASSFDFDQYLSSVFSFLYKSSNISSPTSSNQSSQDPSHKGSNINVKMYEFSINGLSFNIKVLSIDTCMEVDVYGIASRSNFVGKRVSIKRELGRDVLSEFYFGEPTDRTDNYGNAEVYYGAYQTPIFGDNSELYLYVNEQKHLICGI